MTWDDMEFWNTGEWQVIEERLDDLDKEQRRLHLQRYNPLREDLFAALDAVDPDKVTVAIFGQDPYPQSKYCTGVAFSIPVGEKDFPPTLQNIFKEYSDDLHYTTPSSGDLTPWVNQGVLLWNVTPTCEAGVAGSHMDWVEYEELNKEIIKILDEQGIVFVFLGNRARAYSKYVDQEFNKVIELSHPSPLGVKAKKNCFLGSRLFTRINDYSRQLGNPPINWQLPGSKTTR